MVTKKQVLWTLGMAIAGFFLGLKGQDTPEDVFGTALIVLWFASIGFGLGGIFSKKMSSRRIVINWAVTLAAVFPFVALASAAAVMPNWPRLPFAQQVAVGISGACIGALAGIGAGKVHLRCLRTNSRIS
jgi:peptidoglycan/LPS O-acetylase OafA/YrhL